MTQEDVKALIARRGRIKATTTRIKTFLEKFRDDDNIYQLKSRLPNLRNAFKEFDQVQTQLESLQERERQDKERHDFETDYYNIVPQILALLDSLEHAKSKSINGQGSSAVVEQPRLNPVRISTLDLPSFSGSYLEWTAVADTFKSLYSEIEKFSNRV
jgi:molecular chaperone GrpE (heat shock protein)